MPPFFNDIKCTFINTTKSFTAIQRSIFINYAIPNSSTSNIKVEKAGMGPLGLVPYPMV